MKLTVTLLSIFACAAFADQEFYRGDTTVYGQPGAPKKQREGFISFPGGTYIRMGVGVLDQIALRITPSEVQVFLSQNTETLTGEKKKRFLSGEMVTLSSGRRDDTIVAVASAPGPGRRAIVRISGPDAQTILSTSIRPAATTRRPSSPVRSASPASTRRCPPTCTSGPGRGRTPGRTWPSCTRSPRRRWSSGWSPTCSRPGRGRPGRASSPCGRSWPARRT